MVVGVISIPGEKKRKGMPAAHPNIRTFCSSVIVLHENALQQKSKGMIKGKYNRSHIHFSSTESTAGARSCVCQTAERDTVDGEGRGWGEKAWGGEVGAGRRKVHFCFILPQKILSIIARCSAQKGEFL